MNIQYEDKEESKKNYFQKDNNNNYKGGNYYQKNNEYNNDNEENANNGYKKNFYNKNYNKFPKKNFYFQNKSKNNKFDQVNGIMYNPMMYGDMGQNMMNPYSQHQQNFNQQDQYEMDPFFGGERSVEEIISYIFSSEFLNKEVYIRKRIGVDGLIDLNHVLNYNK